MMSRKAEEIEVNGVVEQNLPKFDGGMAECRLWLCPTVESLPSRKRHPRVRRIVLIAKWAVEHLKLSIELELLL